MQRNTLLHWSIGLPFAVLCIIQIAAEPAPSVQQHVREFDVFVDGAKVGTSRVEVAEHPDQRAEIKTAVDIKIRVLFFTYKHQHRSTEVWRSGRPHQIDGQTHAGTEVKSIKAVSTAPNTTLTVNSDAQQKLPLIHHTTTFWCWPEDLDKTNSLQLLNVDNGESVTANYERIGEEQVQVGTDSIKCTHYKLTGGTETDLWFDSDRRLVQKKSLEEGHRAELRLQSITRKETPVATASKGTMGKN